MFTAIELEWGDRIYTIQPRRVMPAIAIIENHFTLQELGRYSETQTIPFAKLCMAYGAVLRYAGATVDDADIYALMFRDGDGQQMVANAILQLIQMMLPAEARAKFGVGAFDEDAGESPASGEAPAAAAASSKKRTKPRSPKADGFRRRSSGG